jgi:hypothetical protein
MQKYKLNIRRKEYEFSFEEENIKAFKDGLQPFIELVGSFEKPVSNVSNGSKASKRGGRRPPFIKGAIIELIKKEPEWMVDKFPENVADKLKTQYGVVGAKTESVNVALIRYFKKGLLARKEMQGKYAYSVQTIPQ